MNGAIDQKNSCDVIRKLKEQARQHGISSYIPENGEDQPNTGSSKADDKDCKEEVAGLRSEVESDEGRLCIDEFETAQELEDLGLDVLKRELQRLGLKCGGTLKERADRLFLSKGVEDPAQLPRHVQVAH
mmetsp:Transcript_65028/g.89368  ORF Transcript_65028/g.89368 Transcript_65028/m.89368 type:complete len:130 (-) Transcript_65028:614-1003(-)